MGSKLKWISRAITALISYLFISAPEKKLLFLDHFFAKEVHVFIFEHPWFILFILIIAYIVVEFIATYRNRNKTIENQCQNMCRYIYRHIDRNIGSDFTHSIRITIFKAMKPNTEDVYLKAVSRYQVKEPLKKTRVTFRPGEGVAGCCFQTQNLIYGHLSEYTERTAETYYRESKNIYNLGRDKIDQLNIKSCLFLGIPIKCFDTEKTWGVLLLDSTKRDEKFSKDFARKIEEIIEHYTAFFTEGDK